jgi:hypothetical protein
VVLSAETMIHDAFRSVAVVFNHKRIWEGRIDQSRSTLAGTSQFKSNEEQS